MANFKKPRTKKKLTRRNKLRRLMTSSKNKACRPRNYDQIVSLVAKSCGELPGELVVEILCKLPVKSLTRFKAVCKPWKLLINSPVFIDNHLHRPNPEIGGYTVNCTKRDLSRQEEKTTFHGDIVGACNGIVCLQTYHFKRELLLFNPSTREFSFLPPECKAVFYGFCYLPETQEYQIICFHDQWSGDYNKIDLTILTLGNTKSLRYVKNKEVACRSCYDDSSRVATCGTSIYYLGMDDNVICYDAVEERFSEIPLPPSSLVTGTLRVLKDSLIMFVYPMEPATSFDIWTLGDGSKDKTWIKYRTVEPFTTSVIL